MQIIVKKPGVPAEIVDVDYTYRGECSKLISDETITTEYVNIVSGEFVMMVDEDGLPKQLPLNFFISTNNPFHPVQAIVGTAVFCRYKWVAPHDDLWDYELEDVTCRDRDFVDRLLRDSIQVELHRRYRDGWN